MGVATGWEEEEGGEEESCVFNLKRRKQLAVWRWLESFSNREHHVLHCSFPCVMYDSRKPFFRHSLWNSHMLCQVTCHICFREIMRFHG